MATDYVFVLVCLLASLLNIVCLPLWQKDYSESYWVIFLNKRAIFRFCGDLNFEHEIFKLILGGIASWCTLIYDLVASPLFSIPVSYVLHLLSATLYILQHMCFRVDIYIYLLLSMVVTTVSFSLQFFFSDHDNWWTAALSLMKFCVNMFLDNCSKPREFQDHRSKVKVTGLDFRSLCHCEIGQKSLWTR